MGEDQNEVLATAGDEIQTSAAKARAYSPLYPSSSLPDLKTEKQSSEVATNQ